MNPTVIAETLRRHLTSGAYLVFLLFLAMVALGVSRFDSPAALWPTLVGLLAIVAGAGLIGPEFSSGTLQLILVKPVNRSVYLLSRYAGVVAAVWIAAAFAFLFEAAGRVLLWDAPVPWDGMFPKLIFVAAAALLTCALLAFFGSLTRAYLNVAVYFLVMIGLSVTMAILGVIRGTGGAAGQFLRENTIIERTLLAVEANLFPDFPPGLDRQWLLRVAANAAVALVLACFAFRRREVPYGAE
ncbi:MAG TPA: ABC transporter permease subunit [Thermoanaerobaculia bacterium]|nr:ABC transporter permease subunit [Thermoanaerobaculia bacterium]